MPVRFERRGEGAFIILDRPEARNALDKASVAAIREGVARAGAEPDVRALIFLGEGSVFCAGADLKERRGMTLDETRAYLGELGAMMNEVATMPRPTLAAIGGSAFGGGLELALACDLRIASDEAELGLTEVRVGIMPGAGGTQRLPRLVGEARAKELILLGRRIKARQALGYGLVSEVVPRAELGKRVQGIVAEIADCAPLAVAKAKEAIRAAGDRPLEEGLAIERSCYEVTLVSEDRQEGLRAFAEKRKPVFQGR